MEPDRIFWCKQVFAAGLHRGRFECSPKSVAYFTKINFIIIYHLRLSYHCKLTLKFSDLKIGVLYLTPQVNYMNRLSDLDFTVNMLLSSDTVRFLIVWLTLLIHAETDVVTTNTAAHYRNM